MIRPTCGALNSVNLVMRKSREALRVFVHRVQNPRTRVPTGGVRASRGSVTDLPSRIGGCLPFLWIEDLVHELAVPGKLVPRVGMPAIPLRERRVRHAR